MFSPQDPLTRTEWNSVDHNALGRKVSARATWQSQQSQIREVSGSRISSSFWSWRATSCHAVIQEGRQGPDLTSQPQAQDLHGTSKSGTGGSSPQSGARCGAGQGGARPGPAEFELEEGTAGSGAGPDSPGAGPKARGGVSSITGTAPAPSSPGPGAARAPSWPAQPFAGSWREAAAAAAAASSFLPLVRLFFLLAARPPARTRLQRRGRRIRLEQRRRPRC